MSCCMHKDRRMETGRRAFQKPNSALCRILSAVTSLMGKAMTIHLKDAIALAEKLPEDKQNMIAALIKSIANNERPVGLGRGQGRILSSFLPPCQRRNWPIGMRGMLMTRFVQLDGYTT